jgi:hypothetical protein
MIDPDRIRDSSSDPAFTRIFWALLIVLIDIRIGGTYRIDLAADFVGWIIVFSALGWMENVHSDVRTIRSLTGVQIFVSLFDLFERSQPKGSGFQVTLSFSPLAIGAFVSLVLGAVIIWKLCGLVMDFAKGLDDPVLRVRAEVRRKMYLALCLVLPAAFLIALVVPPLGMVLVIGAVIYAVLVFVLILLLMLNAASACRKARKHRDIVEAAFEPSEE